MLTSTALSVLCSIACPEPPGDTPPPGAPWLLSYREARRDALLRGRPIMVYFSKTY